MKKYRVISNRDYLKPPIKKNAQAPIQDCLIPKTITYNGPQEKILKQIEERFLEVSELQGDLSKSITQKDGMQVQTDKEKSDKHGEVFTPLWLVDKMLDRVTPHDWKKQDLTTFDLCSGYGQFTIRMLRRRYNYLGEILDIARILSEYHLMAEIQPSSCFKLLYIFGPQVRLLIGDASKMGELPDTAEHGIWVYNKGRWEDRTEMLIFLFNKYTEGTISERAEAFEKKFNSLKTLCEKKDK